MEDNKKNKKTPFLPPPTPTELPPRVVITSNNAPEIPKNQTAGPSSDSKKTPFLPPPMPTELPPRVVILSNNAPEILKNQIPGPSSGVKNPLPPKTEQRTLGVELQPPALAPLTQNKPREMVKKGKSMVEWMQKKKDLSSNKIGRLREIGLDELATHGSVDDLWMALKGKVYDVTQYAAYHPGGVEELMRGAGINATSVFNGIHAYVNFESILDVTQVGFLVGKNTLVGQEKKAIIPVNSAQGKGLDKAITVELRPPIMNFSENESHVFCQVDFVSEENYTEDWWTVGILGRERFLLKVLMKPPDLWMAHLKLVEALRDNTIELSFKNNFKTILVALRKPDKGKWKMLGDPLTQNDQIVKSHRAIQDMHYAKIISKKNITHNVVLLTLEVNRSSHIGVPIGFHVKLRTKEKYRRYTPVCPSIINDSKGAIVVNKPYQRLYFIIKIYPEGQFTSLLDRIPVVHSQTAFDDNVTWPKQTTEELEVGCSSGTFTLEFLKSADIMLFLAAGSGITPIVRILKYVIDQKKKLFSKTQVMLVFFNQEERDIIFREEWEGLIKLYPWFTFISVLSKADDKWKGLRGRVSSQLLKQCLERLPMAVRKNANVKRSIVCGNYGFNKLCKSCVLDLTILKFLEDDVYVFAG